MCVCARVCARVCVCACVCVCRLQQLDQHCQSSAQQVLELLARQNQLTQERHVLNEEMQNLRIQVEMYLCVCAISKRESFGDVCV